MLNYRTRQHGSTVRTLVRTRPIVPVRLRAIDIDKVELSELPRAHRTPILRGASMCIAREAAPVH